MHVFHIPSWFPSRHEQISGISCENLIRCISEQFPDTENTVSLVSETSFRFLFKEQHLFSEIRNYIKASPFVRADKINANLVYLYAPKSLIYSNKLGFDEWAHDFRMHKKNLEFCIKEFGKPDLIHAQVTYTGGYCAYLLHKEFDIPYIITERYAPFPHPSFSVNERLIDNVHLPLVEASKVISVSPAFALKIEKAVGREVQSVPNFLDEEYFKPGDKAIINDVFTFSTLAVTYEPRKGIDILLRSIRLLKDRGIVARFKIGGGNEDAFYHRLKNLENELDINDYIDWFQKINRSQVVDLMRSSDCFVMPSLSESFGTVYIEAIACGTPVVATRCGGPESIVNEQVGILINTNSIEELANALIDIIKRKNDFSQDVIRKYFLDNFSKKVVTKKYINLYKDII